MNEHDQLPESLRKLRPKGDGFRRPDDAYLRQLTERVVSSAQSKASTKKTSARVRKLPSWVAGIAATLLLLLWFQPWNAKPIANEAVEPTNTAAWEQQLAGVSDDDLLAYIQENIEEFELETLVTANE